MKAVVEAEVLVEGLRAVNATAQLVEAEVVLLELKAEVLPDCCLHACCLPLLTLTCVPPSPLTKTGLESCTRLTPHPAATEPRKPTAPDQFSAHSTDDPFIKGRLHVWTITATR